MKISMWFINSLLFSFFFSSCVHCHEVMWEYSLTGPFIENLNQNLKNWDLTGSAELKANYVRLTTDKPGKQGAIWNHNACKTRGWEMQLEFRIHGKGANLNGDGIALWYAKEPLRLGRAFGSKDHFSGLGIFIDTYENHSTEDNMYPRISVMVNNGTLHYDSDNDGIHTQISSCHVQLRNLEHKTRIAVSYAKSTLTVYTDAEGLETWKECFVSHGIHLPTGYYFGISASTGELSDNHDVLEFHVLNTETADVQEEDRGSIIPEAEYFVLPKEYKGEIINEKHSKLEEPSSIFKIILYIAITVTILIIIIIIFRKYSLRRKERMQKRLF